jgi:hypothetical protein
MIVKSNVCWVLLAIAALAIASCFNQPVERGIKTLVDDETAKELLERHVSDFETIINSEYGKVARKQILQKYGRIFYEFAKAHPDTESGANAWCYAMGFGDKDTKEEAMTTVLRLAEHGMPSAKSVELLGEVCRNGDDDHRATALDRLNKIAIQKPVTDISVKSLQILSTMKEIPEGTRDVALNRWVEEFLKRNETIDLVQRLSEHQCLVNEKWLKEIAAKSRGETRATAIFKLATYLNRRDSVRDFYKDAPPSRFEGLPKYFEEYLEAPIDPKESKRMVELLKSVETSDENLLADVKRELFAIEHLAVGKQAPEIEGTDFEGTKFKLSDYRGKVVFLDFWGDW